MHILRVWVLVPLCRKCRNGKCVPSRFASFLISFFMCEWVRFYAYEMRGYSNLARRNNSRFFQTKMQKFHFLVACRACTTWLYYVSMLWSMNLELHASLTVPDNISFRKTHVCATIYCQRASEWRAMNIEHTAEKRSDARCPLHGCASVKTLRDTMNNSYTLNCE